MTRGFFGFGFAVGFFVAVLLTAGFLLEVAVDLEVDLEVTFTVGLALLFTVGTTLLLPVGLLVEIAGLEVDLVVAFVVAVVVALLVTLLVAFGVGEGDLLAPYAGALINEKHSAAKINFLNFDPI